MAVPMRNPKDSMTSTWRRWDHSKWGFWHRFLDGLNVHHVELDKPVPVHQKSEKVPYAPEAQFHVWVLLHAAIPVALQQAYVSYTNHNLPPWAVWILYHVALTAIAVHQVHILRRLGHTYGFFDGDKHERDGVPDVGLWRTSRSLLSVMFFRPLMMIYFTYDINQYPSSIDLVSLPFKIGIYAIVLDFWFYWYHRLMHATESLWKFHRTHHLTKHPNPLLTSYADHEQEFFDIVGIPMMTYGTLKLLGMPFSFYDWWFACEYVVFTEVLGHSGLRMEATAINPLNFLLRILDMELVIEDHDLHHRQGWKKSHNYGKQTRVWDRLFGTTRPRIEGYKDNIDYVNTAKLPLW
ncbi:conserved hypothetical protein [Paecilomyces variotii No. 5]|uniref:Fatty acid hydroxylase domain-containing protein n=1 Tax=Byssochlamys spectabilis (strain No. 5 / NBRC 109023) TaxID=1356009 RepID=V5G6J8_BYSSN|nr:conserved hypothetical protein [Paecilomyces variotii No. 5]